MNYGNPKKIASGATLTLTGMTMGEQVCIVLAALILITAIAVWLRKGWRHGKGLSK